MANARYHRKKLLAANVPTPPAPTTTGSERLKWRHSDNGALIAAIKEGSANMIDICQHMKGSSHPAPLELERLCDLAQTRFEEAAMWAVKAATL